MTLETIDRQPGVLECTRNILLFILTESYRFAELAVTAPFEYSSMLFALLIGYFLFNELPSMTMILGALLVVMAGLIIVWREHRLGIERKRSLGAAAAGVAPWMPFERLRDHTAAPARRQATHPVRDDSNKPVPATPIANADPWLKRRR